METTAAQPTHTQQDRTALLFGLSAVLLWSTVATAFKITLRELTPIQMLAFANLVSCLILTLVCIKQRKFANIYQTFKQRPAFFIALGIINPLCYYLILFKAYALLPASQAQALNYSWGITFTLLAAFFLKQKIRRQDYLAAVLCYLGVLVIATKGNLFTLHFDNPLGVVLALSSTLLWAGYWIMNTRNQADPTVSLLLGFLISLPFSIGLMIYQGFTWNAVTFHGWMSVIYVGLFEMGITFLLWLSALKQTTNTARISNLIYLSPFISLLLLHFIINETIYSSTLIGLCLIIGGLGIQQMRRHPK